MKRDRKAMPVGWDGNDNHIKPQINIAADIDRVAFTIDETALKASLSRGTLYELIREGRLRAVKCGRRTLIRAVDLDAFLASLPPMGGAR